MNSAVSTWKHDTNILADLRTGLNDKLYVRNDSLHLARGMQKRTLGTLVAVHPGAVANYFARLINITAKDCFENLKSSQKDSNEFYEEAAEFKRECKWVYKRLSNLQYTFRDHDCSNPVIASRFSHLFELAYGLHTQVKEFTSKLNKPPLDQRPAKQIDYNERTELTEIKYTYPSRVPLESTIKAARKAFSLAQQKPNHESPLLKGVKIIASGTALSLPVIALGILTLIKILIWNPIELLVRGEVRTLSPLRSFFLLIEKATLNQNRHMQAYLQFSTQILHCPEITCEVAEAFKELSFNARHLDLNHAVLASNDITELAPFIKKDKRPGALPPDLFLNLMKEVCEKNNVQLKSLNRANFLYETYNDCYLGSDNSKKIPPEELFNKFVSWGKSMGDIIGPHAAEPYVSPRALHILLQSAASSPTCKKITLSESLARLPFVQDFLKSHSFRLIKDTRFSKKYRRLTAFQSWV